MTQRTAHMDLEWGFYGNMFTADLPAIPGYPVYGLPGKVTVLYDSETGNGWMFQMEFSLSGNTPAVLTNDDFRMGDTETDAEMISAVDNLDVYDIAHALDDAGYEPMVDDDGEYVVAARHASHRTASMDLTWVGDDGDSYSAFLPFIPGYPVGYNTVAVMPASVSGDDKLEYDTGWWFMMFIHTNDGGDVLPVSPVDFGIYDTFPTAEDTMQFIENDLSPESVSQVLEDMDFMPVRDENGDWFHDSTHSA